MKATQFDQPTATGKTSSFSTSLNFEGDAIHFATVATKAKPKPAGKALLAGVAGFIAIVIISFTSSAKGELSTFAVLMAAVFGIGIGWILQHFRLNDERVAAADTRFFIGPMGINALYPEDIKIPKHAVDLLRIRNTMTGSTAVLNQFIGTPGLGSAVAHTGTAIRNQLESLEADYRQHLADNSFVVEVQSNGKTAILAGGLDESTATDLMNAISRAVNQP